MLAEIDEGEVVDECSRRGCDHDLPAVSSRHDARGAVQHGTEVIAVSLVCLSGRDPHSYGQVNISLSLDRRADRAMWRCERGAHAVTGVLEQPTAVPLD